MSDEDILDLPEKLPFGLTALSIKVVAACAIAFFLSLAGYMFEASRVNWPTTTGSILTSRLIQAKKMSDQVQASYSYSVNEKTYSGSTYFAPGPDLPDIRTLKPGAPVKVYFNQFLPSLSTISPDSELRLYMMSMLFSVLAGGACMFFRPDLNERRQIRQELPRFLETFGALVEKGVSIPAAIDQAGHECKEACPNLCKWVEKSVINLKVNKVALHQSFREIGDALEVNELCSLASTLATASITGGDVGFQLRAQCDSLANTLRSETEAEKRISNNFGGNR